MVRAYIAAYVSETLAVGRMSPTTAQAVRRTLERILGDVTVEGFDRAWVVTWREGRRRLAPGSQRAEWSRLRGFTAWATERGHIAVDPCNGVPAPKVPRSVPRHLTMDDVEALWAVLPDQRARCIVAMLLGLGLRRSELASLQVADWDEDERTIRIVGKGGHVRVLPVPDPTALELRRYLATVPATSGPLIRSQRDGMSPITGHTIGRLVTGWLTDADIKHRAWDGKAAHALRHTFAAGLFLGAGGDLLVVQEALGHASVATTAVYLRSASNVERIRRAMERHPSRPRQRRNAPRR